jgi:hypothetical protein
MRSTLPFLAALLAAAVIGADDIQDKYTWKPMRIGGAGFVVGMWVHPTETNLVFCRADVSGAFRWNEGARTWTRIVTDASMPASAQVYGSYGGVDSIVGAKSDAGRVYMTFNDVVYRSDDTGATWTAASAGFSAEMNANGGGRTLGERLAVDPRHEDVVYYGSTGDGLWYTLNAGASWSQIPSGTVPFGTDSERGISSVEFDETSGTNAAGRTKRIYVTPWGAGVYRSQDAGATWQQISGGSGPANSLETSDAEVDGNGNYYLVSGNQVWRCTPGGVWSNLRNSGSSVKELAVDPYDPARIFLMQGGGSCYRSTDAGASWSSALGADISTNSDAPYLLNYHSPNTKWLSVGELVFSTTVSNRLWLSEGFGMILSDDLDGSRLTWTFYNTGIEELCGNDVIAPPGGAPIGVGWDLNGFRFSDPDQNAEKQIQGNVFSAAWSLDWMGANPSNIVALNYNQYNWANRTNLTGYSTDGGITWQACSGNLQPPADTYYGCIAVSASNLDNMVWVPANTQGPFYTKDRGATWLTSSNAVSCGWASFTLYRKHLTADKVLGGVFYLYSTDNRSIYRSVDGGVNWVRVGDAPCYYRYNLVMKAVPGHAGHLWFAEGKEQATVGPLWRSTNGGATWTQAGGGVQQAFNVGFGKPATPGGYPTIFIAGVVSGQRGIYRSTDEGASWDKIGVNPVGLWATIDAIDGDKDVFGKVYVAFDCSGFAYGATAEKPVEDPEFSPPPGTYRDALSVTVSCATAGASIRYTRDGSTPATNHGLLYTAPVSVTADVTISAIAYSNSLPASGVVSGRYYISSLTMTTTSLPPATAGDPYTEALIATGGAPVYAWTLVAGALPEGLALMETGYVYGTPTATGTSAFSLCVTDTRGASITQPFTLHVLPETGGAAAACGLLWAARRGNR